jgi:hypothetical protein
VVIEHVDAGRPIAGAVSMNHREALCNAEARVGLSVIATNPPHLVGVSNVDVHRLDGQRAVFTHAPANATLSWGPYQELIYVVGHGD